MRRKNTVLKCYKDMAETVTYSEIGMSMAMLEAGYNIDSLMLRYQVNPNQIFLCMSTPNAHTQSYVLPPSMSATRQN